MTEKELIKQFKILKNIKPSKEWAILCKQKITGTQAKEEQIKEQVPGETKKSIFALTKERIEGVSETISNMTPSFRFKPAFATIACFGLILSVFGVSQSALPGDPLYPAKKITEKIQFNLASEQEKPDMQIAMTNKKMQELNQVVQANLGKNLAPAIQEVEQSAQETAKTLEKLTESVKVTEVADTLEQIDAEEVGQPETKYVLTDTAKIKETLAQIQEIESAKQEIQKTHSVIVETPELDEALDNCYKTLVEMEIQAMESQTLLEEQEALLQEIQELMELEQYQQAFEKLLIGQ
jgi:hypothetical protein